MLPLAFLPKTTLSELHFGHFRMAAGCKYNITAEDVAHTHAIDKTKLMLNLQALDITYDQSSHRCNQCVNITLTDAELLLMDDLPSKLGNVAPDVKISLFHKGGYIAYKENGLAEDSNELPEEIRKYTDTLSRVIVHKVKSLQ